MNRKSRATTPERILRELLELAGSQPMLDHAIERARKDATVNPPDVGEIVDTLLVLRKEFLETRGTKGKH